MRRLICVFAAVLLTIGIGPAGAQTKPTTVKLAALAPSALLWVHAIAEAEGFYRAEGLQVDELRTSDSPALLQAVATGSANAGVSLGDVVIRAIDRGAPVIMAGAVLDHTILRLLGDKGVTQVKELAGKPVTAGAVEGGTANLLRYQLKLLGVDPRGVQMVSIPNSRDRLVAMQNGQVAGALMIAPFDTLAEHEGMKVLDVYREPYVQTPLILNTDWAKANRPTAIALVRAFRSAASWINDPAHRSAAAKVLADYTKTPVDVSEASYDFIVAQQKAIPADFSVSAAGLTNIIKIDREVAASATSDKPFDLARYYDPSYLAGK
jgi:ABC-type nitrate/sulfonate/bicarbonate transport system substrate-binding protein